MLARQITLRHPLNQANSFPPMPLQPLGALFASLFLCFQQLAASFCKTPGWGVLPRCLGVDSAPSASRRYHLPSLLSALCFHTLTKPFFRKPFIFTSMQNPWGVEGGRASEVRNRASGESRCRRVRGRCCLRSFWRRRITLVCGRGSTAGCRCRRSRRPCCA